MYKFVDTTEVSEGTLLPSEALCINGSYIENLIKGYRTLTVSGREALSPEIETLETGTRDGSTLKSKRYPARVIIVQYQLIAESATAFRSAYNQLAKILDVENAELIFNDEPDKFFKGTPLAIGEVDSGRNAVVGEFEILCVDPFKYSVEEYEVSPVDLGSDTVVGKVFEIDYNGTYKSFPTLQANFYEESETDGSTTTELTGNGDCGFVAFIADNGKIIQLGDEDESDSGDAGTISETLVAQNFNKATSWGSAAQAQWAVNSQITAVHTIEQIGSIGVKQKDDEYFLTPANYGTAAGTHGASITRTLPQAATHFNLTYAQKMCISEDGVTEKGCFQALLTDANKQIVAGVHICKPAIGSQGELYFYINNTVVHTQSIDLSANNAYFSGNGVKTSTIKKEGDTVTFNIGGIKQSFKVPSIANMAVTKISFIFGQYGSTLPLDCNGLYYVKFVKNNQSNWRNVANKFSAGDVVVVDCGSGEITVNNSPAPEYGALGNDFENFYLIHGANKIVVVYSDWVFDAYAPTFKLRYREVFL